MENRTAISILEAMAVDMTGALGGLRKTEPMADVLQQRLDAINMAQDALRAQQEAEKNDPLTVEELREMKNTPVFVVPLERVPKDEWSEWCVMNYAGNIAHIPGVEYMWWDVDNYGKEWLAYRRQPSKEG